MRWEKKWFRATDRIERKRKREMSDKVIGGRGHKISPVARGTSKIAYSPCPKIDPDNCLNLGSLPTPNGNFTFIIFSLERFWSVPAIDIVKFIILKGANYESNSFRFVFGENYSMESIQWFVKNMKVIPTAGSAIGRTIFCISRLTSPQSRTSLLLCQEWHEEGNERPGKDRDVFFRLTMKR